MQRGAIDAPRKGWSWLGCGMDRPQCLYDHLYRYGSRRGGTSWGGGQARRQDIAHGETNAELHVRDFDLSFDRASSHNVWLISGSRNWQRVERELKVFVLQ